MNIPVNPPIVVLCGSTRFRAEMAAANRRFTLEGFIVLAPGVFAHDGDEITDAQKEQLDELHFRKIDHADAVYIVDPGGYIGDSTRLEIHYARRTGKTIARLSEGTQLDLPPREVDDPAAWLVWSNAENSWWRANGAGYCQDVLVAGRFTLAEAKKACQSRTWDGHIPPEVMVQLPDLNAFVAAKEVTAALRQSIHQATQARIVQRGNAQASASTGERS